MASSFAPPPPPPPPINLLSFRIAPSYVMYVSLRSEAPQIAEKPAPWRTACSFCETRPGLSDMAEIVLPNSSSAGLTCHTAPGIVFASEEELKAHYRRASNAFTAVVEAPFRTSRDRSEWHRHNLKRKVANLQPITKADYESRLAGAKFAFAFRLCSRSTWPALPAPTLARARLQTKCGVFLQRSRRRRKPRPQGNARPYSACALGPVRTSSGYRKKLREKANKKAAPDDARKKHPQSRAAAGERRSQERRRWPFAAAVFVVGFGGAL